MSRTRECKFFISVKGCSNGDDCKFAHTGESYPSIFVDGNVTAIQSVEKKCSSCQLEKKMPVSHDFCRDCHKVVKDDNICEMCDSASEHKTTIPDTYVVVHWCSKCYIKFLGSKDSRNLLYKWHKNILAADYGQYYAKYRSVANKETLTRQMTCDFKPFHFTLAKQDPKMAKMMEDPNACTVMETAFVSDNLSTMEKVLFYFADKSFFADGKEWLLESINYPRLRIAVVSEALKGYTTL